MKFPGLYSKYQLAITLVDKKASAMNYSEAMMRLTMGDKVTRKMGYWDNQYLKRVDFEDATGLQFSAIVLVNTVDDFKDSYIIPSVSDLEANDWEIYHG